MSEKESVYTRWGNLWLSLLAVVMASLALSAKEIGPMVVIVFCLLVLFFKLDMMMIKIERLVKEFLEKR